jgi:putative ABC transport system substrate-binding protein
LGYLEGQNIVLEDRWAVGNPERLPALAAELVRLPVDVIVTGDTVSVQAAKHATTTIPIVAGGAGDLVGSGLVASLARPGGNITGLTDISPKLGCRTSLSCISKWFGGCCSRLVRRRTGKRSAAFRWHGFPHLV